MLFRSRKSSRRPTTSSVPGKPPWPNSSLSPQWGKIRAMNNFKGELVNEATPSMPVEIIGLTGVSEAGDGF